MRARIGSTSWSDTRWTWTRWDSSEPFMVSSTGLVTAVDSSRLSTGWRFSFWLSQPSSRCRTSSFARCTTFRSSPLSTGLT
jgi:hypothetical protein